MLTRTKASLFDVLQIWDPRKKVFEEEIKDPITESDIVNND